MRFESIDFHRQLDCQVQCAIWWLLSLPRTWPQIEFGAKRGWRGAGPFRIVRGQYFIWFTYTFNYSIKSNSLLQAGNMPKIEVLLVHESCSFSPCSKDITFAALCLVLLGIRAVLECAKIMCFVDKILPTQCSHNTSDLWPVLSVLLPPKNPPRIGKVKPHGPVAINKCAVSVSASKSHYLDPGHLGPTNQPIWNQPNPDQKQLICCGRLASRSAYRGYKFP